MVGLCKVNYFLVRICHYSRVNEVMLGWLVFIWLLACLTFTNNNNYSWLTPDRAAVCECVCWKSTKTDSTRNDHFEPIAPTNLPWNFCVVYLLKIRVYIIFNNNSIKTILLLLLCRAVISFFILRSVNDKSAVFLFYFLL